MMRTLPVYIGFDSREAWSYEITAFSLLRHASMPICEQRLSRPLLELGGLFNRPWTKQGKQFYDDKDGKPFSTEFSFTRFLIPVLCMYQGWALFCDGDFLFLEDIAKLGELVDSRYAVMVVKHHHDEPHEIKKMDGLVQSAYFRKNWSSLILWNCGHKSNRALTARAVNTNPGAWLHAFKWLQDEEIGELPQSWNHLVNVNPHPLTKVNALHFTLGTPEFDQHRKGPFADVWLKELELCKAALMRNAA